MTSDVARFQVLFEGNPECHGLDGGMYVRAAPDFGLHLSGFAPIGIYPIEDNLVHWGCVDIDEHDVSHPVNLQAALEALGIHSVVELSKSKGYHVWVFLEQGLWVQAKDMRRALLVACEVAGAPAKEVNPKQESLEEGQVGNYVRLPYPGGYTATFDSQVFARYADAIGFYALDLHDGLEYAESRVNSSAPIHAASKLWKPKQREHVEINLDMRDTIERGLSESVKRRLESLPLTRSIMEEGDSFEGYTEDRSSTLTHLAYLCQEARFYPSETLSILIEADLRWAHKYIERDHSDRELRRIVQRVYG